MSYRKEQIGKFDLIKFQITVSGKTKFVHTIRHRRNGGYYPYAVMYWNDDGKYVFEEQSGIGGSSGSVYFPCNWNFGAGYTFDPVKAEFKNNQQLPYPTGNTLVEMAIFVLAREEKMVLEQIKDGVKGSAMFSKYPTTMPAKGELKKRLEENYYDMINPQFYTLHKARCTFGSPRSTDPWGNYKAQIIRGNDITQFYYSAGYKPASAFKEPTVATSAGGEPTMTQRPENTIDNALIRELKDAIKSISQKPTALEERLLQAVIEKTKDIATAEIEEELRGKLEDFITRTYGKLPSRLDIKVAQGPKTTMTGIFHEKLPDILTMLANNIPVMLTGPAGSGKNYSLEQAAKALEIEFYYTGAITQEYKLTGFIDAGGRYHETEFYKAFKNGGLFMLDEVDASSPETLVILNGAIANRYFDFPSGRIHAHEDFRIACAGNTYGTGADMIYVGRNVLDGATLDRFAVIRMDYDLKVEEQLCPDKDFFEFVQAVRKTVFKIKLRHIVGMRASINGYRSIMAGMSKQFVLESILLKGLGIDDLNTLISNLEDSAKATEWGRELGKYQSMLKKAVR